VTLVLREVEARTLLVVRQLWCVVTLVEVLQHCREHFWLLVGKLDTFVRRLKELCSTSLCKVGRFAEDVFVGCEETMCGSD
jgi:hypothetical protein